MKTKHCGKCGQEKDVSCFSKDKTKKCGLTSHCKDCRKARYYANRDKELARGKEYQRKNRDYVLAYKAKYRLKNKDLIRERDAEYRRNNKDKMCERRLAAYAVGGKEKKQEYREKNRSVYRNAQSKRRAAQLKRTPSWANEESIAAYYKEAKRLQELTGIEFHVDHIVPLQGELVSGLHVENNLQLLMAHENLGKSNKFDPVEFCA